MVQVMQRHERLQVVPISQIVGLVEEVHVGNGHCGVNRAHAIIAKQYYGVSRRMIEAIIGHCTHQACAKRMGKGRALCEP